jgi:8-oxo-dGTP pyrophosphatase MutT (NUDIX family)
VKTAGLVALRDRRILLAFSRNKQAYYLPGGKTEPGESSQAALIREIQEELNICLNEEELRFYLHVQAPAFGEVEGTFMEQDCFFQELQDIPYPGAEIEKLRYFDSQQYSLEPAQVPGVVLLIRQLKKDNLID